MLLPMDIRLASTIARFGFVFARRGITPEAFSSGFLPRLVGIDRALEWTMTGRVFSAEEALAGRFVRQLHQPADLLPAARALAREIVASATPIWRPYRRPPPAAAHLGLAIGAALAVRRADC